MVESTDSSRRAEAPTALRDTVIDDARSLVVDAETELGAIELAIERLERGTYATCELCGSPIEPERLATAPTGRHCGAHGARD